MMTPDEMFALNDVYPYYRWMVEEIKKISVQGEERINIHPSNHRWELRIERSEKEVSYGLYYANEVVVSYHREWNKPARFHTGIMVDGSIEEAELRFVAEVKECFLTIEHHAEQWWATQRLKKRLSRLSTYQKLKRGAIGP